MVVVVAAVVVVVLESIGDRLPNGCILIGRWWSRGGGQAADGLAA